MCLFTDVNSPNLNERKSGEFCRGRKYKYATCTVERLTESWSDNTYSQVMEIIGTETQADFDDNHRPQSEKPEDQNVVFASKWFSRTG